MSISYEFVRRCGLRFALAAFIAVLLAAPAWQPRAALAETEQDGCGESYLLVYFHTYLKDAYGNPDRHHVVQGDPSNYNLLRPGHSTGMFAVGDYDLQQGKIFVNWACSNDSSFLESDSLGVTRCNNDTVAVDVIRTFNERMFTVKCYDYNGSVLVGFDKPETGPAPAPSASAFAMRPAALRAAIFASPTPTPTPAPTLAPLVAANRGTMPKTPAQLAALSPPFLTSIDPQALHLKVTKPGSPSNPTPTANDPTIFTVQGSGFVGNTEIYLNTYFKAPIVTMNLGATPQVIVARFPAEHIGAPGSYTYSVTARNPTNNLISAPLSLSVLVGL